MNWHIAHALIPLCAGLACLLPAAACFAQEGGFDPSFGNGGRELVDVSTLSTGDSPTRLILRPDGRLLMAGNCLYTDPQVPNFREFTFCVTQLRADGTYDRTFGPGGYGYMQFNNFSGWPSYTSLVDMIVLKDGRIVLLGQVLDPNSNYQGTQVLLAVLRADGSALDTSVGGGNGFMQFQFGAAESAPSSLVQQPDGKVLVAGAVIGPNGSEDFAVARLLANLSGLDTSFGSGGSASVGFDLGGPTGDNSDVCYVVRLQSNGKIVLAGYAVTSPASQSTATGQEIALVRLNSDGTRDDGFGGNGDGRVYYTVDGNALNAAIDAQIDASDRIVIGGGATESTSPATSIEWVIDRLSANGGRDATFNNGSPRHFYMQPGNYGEATRLALTNDGIFAVGVTARTVGSTSLPYYFAVAHLNANGALDPKFGGGGMTYGSFTATNDFSSFGTGIAVGDGGVMVAGFQEQSTNNGQTATSNFAIAKLRYDRIFSDGFDLGGAQ